MPENTANTRSRRIAVAGAAVGALVAAPLAAWAAGDFDDVPPSHPAYRAVNVAADAGLMTGDGEGNFRPNRHVTRAALASTLHRGLARLAVDDTVSDLPATTPTPELLAAVNLGIDGFERGHQGVLLEHTMQLESAVPLAADCELTLTVVSWPENLDVGEWTTHLHAGDRGATVDAVFTDSQQAGALYTYELSAQHDCGQALEVVQGALVGQTAAFTGNGQPFPQ